MRFVFTTVITVFLIICPHAHAEWKKVAPLNATLLHRRVNAEKCSYRVSYASNNTSVPGMTIPQRLSIPLPNVFVSKEPPGTGLIFESLNTAHAAIFEPLFGLIDTKPYHVTLIILPLQNPLRTVVQFSIVADDRSYSLSSQDEGEAAKLGKLILESFC